MYRNWILLDEAEHEANEWCKKEDEPIAERCRDVFAPIAVLERSPECRFSTATCSIKGRRFKMLSG